MGALALYAWGFVRGAIPYIISVPRWVWVAGAIVVGFLYYGHSVSERVKAQQRAEQALQLQQERARQQRVANEAVHNATVKAQEAEKRAQTLEERLNEAVEEARKAKDAQRVCLPNNVTNKLRYRPKARKP